MYMVTLSDEKDNFLVFAFNDYGEAMNFIGFAVDHAVGGCEVMMHKSEEVGL